MEVTTEHGKLINVLGHGVKAERFTFCLAAIDLDQSSFSPEWGLGESVREFRLSLPPGDIGLSQDLEGIWVLGRLKHLFQVEVPGEEDRPEKSMMSYGFIAAQHDGGSVVAYPFEISDYYGRTCLYFRNSLPHDLKIAIAKEFWTKIVSECDLDDYESELMHMGAPITLSYGVRDGMPFYEERRDG